MAGVGQELDSQALADLFLDFAKVSRVNKGADYAVEARLATILQ